MADFDYRCKACDTKFSISIGFFNRPPVRDIVCPICKKFDVREVPFWERNINENKK